MAFGVARRLWAVALLAALFACQAVAEWESEVNLSDADGKRVDAFEMRRLTEADKSFKAKKYRLATAQYEAFSKEFPRSSATAYAVLRKGRSTQLDLKRSEAIKIYNDLMDYFPDQVAYAAPALYYIGECHLDNGNKEGALKAWKELADDEDYRKQPIAAYALNALAGRLLEQGEAGDAAKYYLQIAQDFRKLNSDAAWRAIGELVRIHIVVRPNVNALRDACTKLKGFFVRPGQYQVRHERIDSEEEYFWEFVREQVSRYGESTKETILTPATRKDFYGYWAGVMEGTRPEDDDFQKDAADFRLACGGKREAWVKRLDEQFAAYQKPGDWDRIVKWISFYRGDKKKMEEYYSMLIFPKMKNDTIAELLVTVLHPAPEMGRSVYPKLHFNEMSDDAKVKLAWRIGREPELAADLFHRMKNENRARMEELRFWHKRAVEGPDRKAAERALPLADLCVLVPEYAKEAYWCKGECLRLLRKLTEAIQAFQMSDDPPKHFYAIADCYVALGKIDEAVTQLREIEKFFVDERSRASLKIADVYEAAGKRDLAVAQLLGVLDKYPESRESSAAHRRLQALGYKTKGGIGAE